MSNLVTLDRDLALELMNPNKKHANAFALKLMEFEDRNVSSVKITAINSSFIRFEMECMTHAKQEVEVYPFGSVNAMSSIYGTAESVPVQAFKFVAHVSKLFDKNYHNL